MLNWYMRVLSNYAGFSGRARRSEFWYYALVNLIIVVVLEILGARISLFMYLLMLYALATIVPSLAVSVRRLHDINKSGWWWFIQLVPIIGPFWALYLMCIEGTHGANQYGADPKAETAVAAPA